MFVDFRKKNLGDFQSVRNSMSKIYGAECANPNRRMHAISVPRLDTLFAKQKKYTYMYIFSHYNAGQVVR